MEKYQKLKRDERKRRKTNGIITLAEQIIHDSYTDDNHHPSKFEYTILKPRYESDLNEHLPLLWDANPAIYEILTTAPIIEIAREQVFDYLDAIEKDMLFNGSTTHPLETAMRRDIIRTTKSIFAPVNEKKAKSSALSILWKLAHGKQSELKDTITIGFIIEFIHIFRALDGKFNIYSGFDEYTPPMPPELMLEGREAALERMKSLNEKARDVQKYFKKFPSGLDRDVIEWRNENKNRILAFYNASEEDWNDPVWQIRNVIRNADPIIELLELSSDQREAIELAAKEEIPFGITPYYLSLMDSKMSVGFDHAVRAQVIPPLNYVREIHRHRADLHEALDFMGEADTSPIDLITRRYPFISILKPYNTCAQICVYCQRNWEIKGCLAPDAMATRQKVDEAIDWIAENPLREVLLTGGDPMVMPDKTIEHILQRLSEIPHIERVRIGTRTPVVMPMRFTDKLMDILRKFHNPPALEIAVVTHFEHSYEITPDAMAAVQKIRKAGISVYNQQVFTIDNSRRFESAKLRLDLKKIGIDPYYTFNMKGKKETRQYMVPIARILQERKEETRLLPGLDRTDEPVFNVPRLGKNHLRSGSDRKLIHIMPDGSRMYEFHPWEKNITATPPYVYADVPIYNYLEELALRGENLQDYKTIWYYF